MRKFYFTYGSDARFPYQSDWTEIEAPDLECAIEIFRQYHPDRPGSGCINCAFYYTQEQWDAKPDESKALSLSDRCRERISIVREMYE